MNEKEILNTIGEATSWFSKNESLLWSYLVHLVVAIVILFVGRAIARVLSNTVSRLMHARDLDPTVTQFLSSLLRYLILTIAIVAALGNVGVQTTSIIAVLGAAGLAVGLALQGSLSNFAAGVLLIVFRPFKFGEYVDLGGVAGTVKNIQIFSSTLYTSDGKSIVVPNSKIISNNIINYSRDPHRRVEIVVGIDYSADIEEVKQLLNKIIAEEPRVIKELGTTVRLMTLGDSALNFVVRVWTTNANFWPVYYDLIEKIPPTMDKNNIRIPFNVLDVNLNQVASVNEQNKP